MFDLIIKNGKIFNSYSSYIADIAVKDEKIVAISEKGFLEEADRIIDAEGMYVIPGIIDPHVHINANMDGICDTLDHYSASKCAAYGGVTTMIDFTETRKGSSVLQAVKDRNEQMSISAIDYGIHAKFIEASEDIIKEINDIVEYGCPSFKLFMTYRRAGFMIEDEDILKVMAEAQKCGAMVGFHAENNAITEYCTDKLVQEEYTLWRAFPKSRPNICESEAVNRVIAYSKLMDCQIYIFHLTTGEAKDIVKRAQNEGVRVTAETCPHYLVLTDEEYNCDDGHLRMMTPPLRSKEDQKQLWEGLDDETLTIIGSDNCTFTREIKEKNLEANKDGRIIQDFTKVISGSSGIEERLALLIAKGINEERLSWNQLVRMTSYNPAKTFGIYPQKGDIAVGFDADIVIIDPLKEMRLSKDVLHYNQGYTIYDGIKVKGWPTTTIRRGDVLVENGEFVGQRGTGRFIRRRIEK